MDHLIQKFSHKNPPLQPKDSLLDVGFREHLSNAVDAQNSCMASAAEATIDNLVSSSVCGLVLEQYNI